MVGMHFVLILPDPNGGPTNIRSGHVTQKLGNSHWLFQFKGKNYPFSNAFNEEQLEKFAANKDRWTLKFPRPRLMLDDTNSGKADAN